MKKFNILVLTDHSGHTKENSLYALVNELIRHPQCSLLVIASRGSSKNDAFFQNYNEDRLFGTSIETPLEFRPHDSFFSNPQEKVKCTDFNVVFMRLPRPMQDSFLSWIGGIFDHAVIVNRPQGMIETSNKKFLLQFPNLCPPIKLCYNIKEIVDFSRQFDIVLKPLKDYGGRGILKISGEQLTDGVTTHSTLQYLREHEEFVQMEGYVAMKFLKNVSQGDKRILVVGGKILASSLRMPPQHSWLCNVAQGGLSLSSDATPREIELIAAISPTLMQKGILIYGADTLVDDDGQRVLSEINTLSIGGFPQAEQQTGLPIIQFTVNEIINYANEHHA